MARINLLPWREAERRRRQKEFAIAAAMAVALVLLLGLGLFPEGRPRIVGGGQHA